MKCLVCEKYGLSVICKDCLDAIPLSPSSRILKDSIKVYSFYRYADIALLMQSKYHIVGSRVLRLLARKAAHYFFTNFKDILTESIALIGLDDYPYGAYSHTGVIVRAFEKESGGIFKGHYGVLKAQNDVKYAGQNLDFRQSNPKGFVLKKAISVNRVVLLDDIITTGVSFSQAIDKLKHYQILFCLSLCDAR